MAKNNDNLVILFFEWILEHIKKSPQNLKRIIEDQFVELMIMDVETFFEILKFWNIDEIHEILQSNRVPDDQIDKK